MRLRLRELEEEEAAKLKEAARNSYRAYVEYVHKGRWKPAPHLELICNALEDVERGVLLRLLLSLPPRHGKSMSVTETFPSWFIPRLSERRVMEVSYGDSLAKRFGRANRRKIEEFGDDLFGVRVSRENRSVTNWSIEGTDGGMISTSITGHATGEGADLLILDDPVKNRKEAESFTYRESLWNEWRDTFLTRLSPHAAVVVIMTRWHEDDLVGRLIKEEPGEWTVLNLPAIAEEDDILGRSPGEALWPDRGFDEKWAAKRKKSVGTRSWESLYQGRPTAAEGNLFKRASFRKFRDHKTTFELLRPEGPKYIERSTCRIFQTCDVAGSTKSSADYFVVGTFALTQENDLLVLNIFRTRIEGPDQPGHLKKLFYEYAPLIQGVETKNMGLTLFQQLRRDGLPIVDLKADVDKFTRAIPASARYEAGTVYHLDGASWREELESELVSFPQGAHDDQVDVIAYSVLVQMWGYLANATENYDDAYVIG